MSLRPGRSLWRPRLLKRRDEATRPAARVGSRAADEPIPEVDLDRFNLRVTGACIPYNTMALLPGSMPFLLISDWRPALRLLLVAITFVMPGF